MEKCSIWIQQGSIIGPLLSIIYITNLLQQLMEQIILFVDDTAVLIKRKSLIVLEKDNDSLVQQLSN